MTEVRHLFRLYGSLFGLLALAAAGPLAMPVGAEDQGESRRIQARVSFLANAGWTTTDGSGITYQSGGWSSHEDKTYPPNYWGTFPLYFVGTTMNFNVALTNTTDRGNKTFKVRVRALNNVLETSGASGMELAPAQEWIVDALGPGETRTLQGSIYIAPNPNLPSGLDITKIQIFHLNEGSNENAALIKEELAVWCPPAAGARP